MSMLHNKTMEITIRVGTGNLIRLRNDHLQWINAKQGDEIILRDDTNKRGQKYIAIWKKGG